MGGFVCGCGCHIVLSRSIFLHTVPGVGVMRYSERLCYLNRVSSKTAKMKSRVFLLLIPNNE